MKTKYLIINADDFGMSPVFNGVILDLARRQLISSTTVMVNRVSTDQHQQLTDLVSIASSTNLSIGLHVEFAHSDYPAQILAQYQQFQQLFGISPSHLDIHRAHDHRAAFASVAQFCQTHALPMRNNGVAHSGVVTTDTEAFFGSVADFAQIDAWLQTFEDEKTYEILFHPGKYDPSSTSSLNHERERDVAHIADLTALLPKYGIKLVSYHDVANQQT